MEYSPKILSQHRPLVVLLGPTAVGKSCIAIQVAKHFATEVLTADSRQVYRGMDVGTDKPTEEEQQHVPHRLINLVDADESFNAGRYRRAALSEIERLYTASRLPFVVGGTGLYIRALVRGLCPAPEPNHHLRAKLIRVAKEQGRNHLHAELARVDPDMAKRLHSNDEAKIIRALEVYCLTGLRMSAMHQQHQFQDISFSPLLIGLRRTNKDLYRRIEERIDRQLTHGIIEETKTLLDCGHGRHLGSMKGLGYRHVGAYLAGECKFEDMVTHFKRDTRHFAKRQMTWFRKEPGVVWISIGEHETVEDIVRDIVALINRFLGELESVVRSGFQQEATLGEGVV